MSVVVAGWLGCLPGDLDITSAPGGVSTPVFGVALGSLTSFLRLSETSNDYLGAEALAHEVVLSYGARVPAVIGYEPFDPELERSVMLTTAVPGTSLNDQIAEDPAPVLFAAGADLARINQVPVDGFGLIQRDEPLPSRLSAPYGNWDAFAERMIAHPLDDWLEPGTRDRISELASVRPENTQRAVLAHGDFDLSHLFAWNGVSSGIIDFGEIRGAEPTFDLGHLALHAPEALAEVMRGYGSVQSLPTDASLHVAASAIRIGWYRLTQSSARSNPSYAQKLAQAMARIAMNPEDIGRATPYARLTNILTVIYI
jgi:aminoglycoside phosphotransferase (APT) family kinase protein